MELNLRKLQEMIGDLSGLLKGFQPSCDEGAVGDVVVVGVIIVSFL